MELLRQSIRDDFDRLMGRLDDPEIFGGPAGDPGLAGGPDGVSWRIHGDVASLSIAGAAAIVLEVLHPSVMAGVHDLSSYREDPFRRARTTFGYVVTTTFANTAAAERLIAQVKGLHARVVGTRPDGTPYHALDPELLGWVHTCIPWITMRAYERFHRPLSPADRDRYLAEQAVIGRRGGAGEIPTTMRDLTDYVEAMRPKLAMTEQTRGFLDFLMESPFTVKAPGRLERPVTEFQLEAGLSLMPRWARRLVGYDHPDWMQHGVFGPALKAYAEMLRWGIGVPAYQALAEHRARAQAAA